ncbi:MAG TPA: transcriptional regulator, partial [Blastocatellia bacterium]|nr:transcriptional regulator [Blastocatellia bacterium]
MVQQGEHFYEFGPFRVDTTERLLLRGGETVALTPKLFDILLVLVSNSGRILEKEEVIKAVWPDTAVEEGSLARNISTLRKALGENPAEPQYIQTIPWRGYRFVAPVRASTELSTELVIEEHLRTRIVAEETETSGAATETSVPVAQPERVATAASAVRLRRILAIGVVGSLAAIAVLSLSLRRPPASGRGAVGFSAYNVTLQ